jgi:uncharacterized protein YndB with AHSA1/START domain
MPSLSSTHLLPCSPERAFQALADIEQLVRWWGPDGFTSTSTAFDFRPGGTWTVTLHGPDGTDYPNFYRFLELEAPKRAVIEHPDPAHFFVLTVGFDGVPGGTQVTWHQEFPDAAHFEEVKDFVAGANQQVLARLATVAAS